MSPSVRSKLLVPILLCAAALAAWFAWNHYTGTEADPGLISGNGRIEATRVDIATKLGGRIDAILVDEGAFVKAGQPLARMTVQVLEAQREEARAMLLQAQNNVAMAQAQQAMRESDRAAAQATVLQRDSELEAAQRRLARSQRLTKEGAISGQQFDDDRADVRKSQATVIAAKAQVAAAEAAIEAARAQVIGSRSAVTAAQATINRIQADIDDSQLTAPRSGRIEYRLAQPGEVLAPGSKVLSLIDLAEVYMTFFVPEMIAGRIALGQEVRIVLDTAPDYVVPARVSFVASSAQFTPKTVETASERQKLMFRVRARIDRALLEKYLTQVKTGVPGVAWIKIDPAAGWPQRLSAVVAP